MCEHCKPIEINPGVLKLWQADYEKLDQPTKDFLEHAVDLMGEEILKAHPKPDPMPGYDTPDRILYVEPPKKR